MKGNGKKFLSGSRSLKSALVGLLVLGGGMGSGDSAFGGSEEPAAGGCDADSAVRITGESQQLLKGLLEGPSSDCTPAVSSRGYLKEGVSGLGTLVIPKPVTCSTLKVYFPGHAQELGLKAKVPASKREKWADILLEGESYTLAPAIVKAGCPVLILGDSTMKLSSDDAGRLLLKTGASKMELLSHSGGYVGLNSTLREWTGTEILEQISGIRMLDNFYDTSTLPKTLRQAFGQPRLQSICRGFYTTHNARRVRSAYDELCPSLQRGVSHKADVKQFFQGDS